MSYALFRRALAERCERLVRGLALGSARFRQRHQDSGIDNEPCLDFRTSHSAYLNLGQCFDREVEPLFKYRGSGEEIARQQEIQYLPAAVGQLEEPKSPTTAQHEDIIGHLVSSGDLLARRDDTMMLPIRVLLSTRFFEAFLH